MAEHNSGNNNQTKEPKEGQEPRPTRAWCATDEVHRRLLLEDPGYAQRRAQIENQAWRAARMPLAVRQGCTKIPVVVHVVYRTNQENISKAQIDSQIDVLNADYRKKNADISNVPVCFKSFVCDARIEFELAKTDPNGNQTDGIVRKKTNVNGFTSNDAVKSSSSGGSDAWPYDKYLNIWVCRLAGGLLGYAQFPGGPASTDGIVITYTAFGTNGTVAAPFDKGRTATHEVGHWLNLRHIWGDDDGACSGSDYVSDTPNQGGPNYGTPSFPTISCGNGPNGDMFMNYMDYVDDASMNMFSCGQVARMQAALDGPRASIGASISCGPKLKFTDEPTKLKFRDDVKNKFIDDPIGTLKFRDDPKNKFVDDPIGTLKFRDDQPGTVKSLDDTKSPTMDKMPGADGVGPHPPMSGPFISPHVPVMPYRQPAPFILATPHHSSAWRQSYPDYLEETISAYEQQLVQYEQMLQEYARAEASGELSETERQAIYLLYAEYTRLAAEYQRLMGGEV
jgi:hypothetical protein